VVGIRGRWFRRREDWSMLCNEPDSRGVKGRKLEVQSREIIEGDMVKTNASNKTVP